MPILMLFNEIRHGFWFFDPLALILLAASGFSKQNSVMMVPLINTRPGLLPVVSHNIMALIIMIHLVPWLN
jgi:hypothetical protein